MYKNTFRTLSKRLLKHISEEHKKVSLKKIKNRLLNSTYWIESNVIAITIPRKIELNTMPIIEEAWKQGKQVVIPKCYPNQDHLMKFFLFTNINELENVYLDLYEPKEISNRLVEKESIDLIIVPGLLFDKNGYRIGYGGGYYDRYLKGYTNKKISIALEDQIVNYIPYDSFDIPVDAIITEKTIYKNS